MGCNPWLQRSRSSGAVVNKKQHLQAGSVRYLKTPPWVGSSFARVVCPWVETHGYKDLAPLEL